MTDSIESAAPEAAVADTSLPVVTDSALSPDTTPAGTAAPAAEEKPTVDQTLRSVWDKLNPKRDEQGRFSGRGDKPATEASTEQADQPAEAQGEPAQPAIAAPLSWSAEQKAKWATLPPDVQKYIAQRDKENHEAISRAGQQIKAYEPIGKVIDHFAETWQRNNLHPADGIARLLEVENRLAKDPASTIRDIAQAYGVDLRDLASVNSAGAEQKDAETPHPDVSILKSELAQTKAELGKVMSYLTAQQRQSIHEAEAGLARQIAEFAEGKPHFEAVRRYMGALMQADESLSLDDAYDRAVWSLPDLRQSIQLEQQKAQEAKRNEEARKRATEAKKSSAVNVKSSTVSGSNPKTMDDTLRETARRLYGHL